MRGLLHNIRQLLRQNPRWRIFSVNLPVRLCALPCPRDQNPEIRTHARIYDPDIGTNHSNTFYHGVIDEYGGRLFLGRDYDSV